jgi:hypothetical protein
MMHSRIGLLRALNRNVEPVFKSERNDKHWERQTARRSAFAAPLMSNEIQQRDNRLFQLAKQGKSFRCTYDGYRST